MHILYLPPGTPLPTQMLPNSHPFPQVFAQTSPCGHPMSPYICPTSTLPVPLFSLPLCVCSVTQMCPSLHGHSPSGSSVHGIVPARTLQWIAISSSRLPHPRIEPRSPAAPALAGAFFSAEPPQMQRCSLFSPLLPQPFTPAVPVSRMELLPTPRPLEGPPGLWMKILKRFQHFSRTDRNLP